MTTPITIHVTRPGPRADELLAEVAPRLTGSPDFSPTGAGPVRLFVDLETLEAREATLEALDAAGGDWHDFLHVNF